MKYKTPDPTPWLNLLGKLSLSRTWCYCVFTLICIYLSQYIVLVEVFKNFAVSKLYVFL